MKIVSIIAVIILMGVLSSSCQVQVETSPAYQDFSIDIDEAQKYLSEVKEFYRDDNERLWGKELYSPLLFIDPVTLDVLANEPDNEGKLTQNGDVYIGKFPKDKAIANSITEFGGKNWAMVMWPLPKDPMNPEDTSQICITIMHEMFHYQQDSLNLMSSEYINLDNSSFQNSHFQNMEARILLQLEWNALHKALNSEGAEKKEAVADALTFREKRRELFTSASVGENEREISEGLANYTAYKLRYSDREELINATAENRAMVLFMNSLEGMFGYQSGLVYGLLLDDSLYDWKKVVRYDSDLGLILKDAFDIKGLNKFEEIKEDYGYNDIYMVEHELQQKKNAQIERFKAIFSEDDTLKLKLSANVQIAMNPSTMLTIEGLGTIYQDCELKDTWGTLTVSNGNCLITNDFKNVLLTNHGEIINESTINGTNWILQLSPEFQAVQENGKIAITGR